MKVSKHIHINDHYYFITQSEIKEQIDKKISLTIFILSLKDFQIIQILKNKLNILTIEEIEFKGDSSTDRIFFYLLIEPQLLSESFNDTSFTLTISYTKLIKTNCRESSIRELKLDTLL